MTRLQFWGSLSFWIATKIANKTQGKCSTIQRPTLKNNNLTRKKDTTVNLSAGDLWLNGPLMGERNAWSPWNFTEIGPLDFGWLGIGLYGCGFSLVVAVIGRHTGWLCFFFLAAVGHDRRPLHRMIVVLLCQLITLKAMVFSLVPVEHFFPIFQQKMFHFLVPQIGYRNSKKPEFQEFWWKFQFSVPFSSRWRHAPEIRRCN